MTITAQIKKRIKKFLLYIFILLIACSLIILIFSMLYGIFGISNCIKYSIDIFLGYETINAEVYLLSIIEITIKYIFSMAFIGGFLLRFLEPINPIATSDYFIYDEVSNKIKFRYWIMLPSDNYLYDIHIRISVMDDKQTTDGNKALPEQFKLDDSFLEMARGVRETYLSKSDHPNVLINMLKSDESKKLYLIISCINEKGNRVHYTKQYKYCDMVKNCAFVPIRSTSFFEESKEKLFFRYHHFDKLYVIGDTVDYKKTTLLKANYPHAANDILQENEVKIKKYGNKKVFLTDLYSELISWYLNR